jgi:type I restriction enzyme M protein
MAKNNNSTQEEHLEKQLWKAADKLRKNSDAAEYKHIVMGLIFLKYISDAFEGLYQKLQQGEGDYAGADPEDRDEYKAENIFFVPAIARWSYLYTPRSVVQLLVEMLEPYNGRVFDPCCGSGGMFVQSEKFVEDHQGKVNDISIYGQESNQTTWRLCKMNLAIRSIDSSQVKWNNEGSFLNDTHKDLKADYVIANPPFNDSDWSGDLLRKDGRWEYGVPPAGNANYAWIQHFLYHLNQSGRAGFVLAKGSLTSKTSGEGDIRKELVEARLVDCIVNLPAKLFLNTQIPACLWFLSRNKANGKYRNRTDEILFIDARNIGHLINRRTREFSSEDIRNVADTYHNWRNPDGDYEDVKGFCKSASIERVRELDYVVTPGRYVGLPVEEDDFDFNERFTRLKAEFEEQLKEEAGLNSQILENLSKIKMEGEK